MLIISELIYIYIYILNRNSIYKKRNTLVLHYFVGLLIGPSLLLSLYGCGFGGENRNGEVALAYQKSFNTKQIYLSSSNISKQICWH